MPHIPASFLAYAQRVVTKGFSPERLEVLIVIGGIYLLWAWGWRTRSGTWPRPNRDLLTDAAYALFYGAGIFLLLGGGRIYGAIAWAMHRFLPFLEFGVLRGRPAWLQFIVLIVACDFMSYWWHRAMHGSRLLWLVHRAHHSQTFLTPLTNYRVHVGEIVGRGIILMLPASILGADQRWLPEVLIIQTALNLLAHSDLSWSYGAAGYALVSPRHHRIHHSAEGDVSQHNFGILLSTWDYLFGTVTPQTERPAAFGIEGERLPRGFLGQQLDPLMVAFRALRRTMRRVPIAAPAEP